MILEFEQYFKPASPRYTDVWSGAQYLSLRALDEKLAALDDSKGDEFWLDDDILERSEWSEIRRQAREAIRVFDWPADEPPPSRAI